jgi:tRNA 2-thiouridine synthesizing protein A
LVTEAFVSGLPFHALKRIVMLSEIRPDAVLDCVGLSCPMPIFKTSVKIKELEAGQVLEVQSDDDGFERDLPDWCKRTGHECLGFLKQDDECRAYIRKK